VTPTVVQSSTNPVIALTDVHNENNISDSTILRLASSTDDIMGAHDHVIDHDAVADISPELFDPTTDNLNADGIVSDFVDGDEGSTSMN
jgi:hypothetical protein